MARTTKKASTKAKGRKQEEVVQEEELDLEEGEDIEDFDLDDEVEDDKPEAPPKNKDTRKAGKQVEEPKKDRRPKKGEPPKHLKVPAGMVTVKDLEEEFGIKGKEIRTILRDGDFTKPEGSRWAWKKSDPDLKRLRKILDDRVKGKGSAKAEKKEAAPAKEKAAPKKKSKKSKS